MNKMKQISTLQRLTAESTRIKKKTLKFRFMQFMRLGQYASLVYTYTYINKTNNIFIYIDTI